MRVSIPGLPGVYYDTDTGTTAIGVAMTAAGRKAPKPKGYAIQALPYLWSFDVDLREVPNDHPLQYLHPEGAQSLGELSPERGVRQAGNELESVLRFVWSVNQVVESGTNQLIGRTPETEGVVIEIEDGNVVVDGDDLETDAFDVDDEPAAESAEGAESDTESFDVDEDEVTDTGAFEDAEEFSSDEFDTGDEFDAGSDDVDPDEP